MGVIARGNKLSVRLKGPSGKWVTYATEFSVGDEAKARKVLERLRSAVAAGNEVFGKKAVPATVREYCLVKFFPKRQGLIEDWKTDQRRMEMHVLPKLGAMPLRDVRARHLISLMEGLRTAGELAPKTIYNVYGVIRALFRDAVIDELIDASPCVLDETHLGSNEDADPEWRDGAVFTRPEYERLLSDPRVPADRQMVYALKGLGCVRDGEADALRWQHYDPSTADPATGALGKLVVARSHGKEHTKTKRARAMPVHPVLAAMLAEWRLSGWPAMMGRNPEPEDLVVPMPAPAPGKGRRAALGSMRTSSINLKALVVDLATLGLRHRTGHDLRRTIITLALEDGAIKDILEQCTHTPKKARAINAYSIYSWPVRSAEVAKLKISRRTNLGAVLPMRQTVGAQSTHVERGDMNSRHSVVTGLRNIAEAQDNKIGGGGNRTRSLNAARGDLPHSSADSVGSPADYVVVGADCAASERTEAHGPCDDVTAAVNRARSEWLSSGSTRTLRRNLLAVLSLLEGEQ